MRRLLSTDSPCALIRWWEHFRHAAAVGGRPGAQFSPALSSPRLRGITAPSGRFTSDSDQFHSDRQVWAYLVARYEQELHDYNRNGSRFAVLPKEESLMDSADFP